MFHVEHFRGAWLGLAGQGLARRGSRQNRMFHVEHHKKIAENDIKGAGGEYYIVRSVSDMRKIVSEDVNERN